MKLTPEAIQERCDLAKAFTGGHPVEVAFSGVEVYQPLSQSCSLSMFLERAYNFRLAQTPEQLRVAANLKLKEEQEKDGFMVEVFNHDKPYLGWRLAIGTYWSDSGLEYRRKPEPRYVPWTFATVPVGTLVRRKIDSRKYVLCGASETHVLRGDQWISYDLLLAAYETLDGQPCGTKEDK